MNSIYFYYPNFESKCLTFSYDDGVIQDIPLLKKMNEAHFKGTFNLNSGLFSQIKFRDGIDNSRLDNKELNLLYMGHEIASHSLYHLHMENLSYEDNDFQIKEDMKNLKAIFHQEIKGFAYPFGTYNEETLKALENNHILYARTTKSTYDFKIPSSFLKWNPTIHHNDVRLDEMIEKFLKTNEPLALFYIWGHSYEFEDQHDWATFDKICLKLKDLEDVAYLTNQEVATYLEAIKKVKIKENQVINDSNEKIYCRINQQKICLNPQESYEVE